MPISAENKKRYPPDWKEISNKIRFERAQGRCECLGECGLHKNYRCVEEHDKKAFFAKGRVILTVAHLDHQPENCDEQNLRAMCQRCHLRYDADHHKQSRIERQNKNQMGLF
jgi:hypothetical protein